MRDRKNSNKSPGGRPVTRRLVIGALAAGSSLVAGAYRNGLKAQPAEVPVAVIAPISGPMARQGDLMSIGARLAVEDINAAGGIKVLGGAKMRLVVVDAGEKLESAKNAAQRLLASEPDLVAGTGAWNSSFTLAVTEVTERAGLPWLTLSYADQITERGFKFIAQTTMQASKLALNSMPTVLDMATKATGQKPATVGIITDSTAASQAFVKPLRQGGFEKLGVKILVDEIFTSPLGDATVLAQRMRAANPDFMLFYSSTGFSDARMVLVKLNEFRLGLKIKPMISVGVQLASPEMSAAIGAGNLDGLMLAVPNWPSRSQKDILPGLEKRSGEPWLNQDTICTYGDMWLIKDAIERAGSADRAKVMQAILATDTKSGPGAFYLGDRLAFDDQGRRVGGAVGLVQWQDGRPVLIWPPSEALSSPRWPSTK